MSTPGVVSPVSPLSSGGFGGKVEMVYSLLGMLGSQDPVEKSKTLLTMTQSPEACVTMRQSGCLPLLVQLIHGDQTHEAGTMPLEARQKAAQALRNVVNADPDEKRNRRENRVLRLLEHIRDFSDYLRVAMAVVGGGRGPLPS
ncbi:unnamed protein product, partial [Darwinula stevensoni]